MVIPKFKETNIQPYDHTSQVINMLRNLGATVLVVITDNNKVNESIFKIFGVSEEQCRSFISGTNVPLFFMYCTVYIFKNLRNSLGFKTIQTIQLNIIVYTMIKS